MSSWGRLETGERVDRFEFAGGGLSASAITLGAAIRDLRIEGHPAPLVLGFEELSLYERHSPYFGAIVGRFANRIGGGRFLIDSVEYRVDRNAQDNCLHGGSKGFSQRVWTVEEAGRSHVAMILESDDGDMGFPGKLTARCRYELAGDGELRVTLSATTDAPTVCSMAHHSYFNLEDGGENGVTGHEIAIHAERYLPVDETLVPTGGPLPVAGTRFDFRAMQRVDFHDAGAAYDLNYCLDDPNGGLRAAAEVKAPRSGVSMAVLTTEPGLQWYTAPSMRIGVPGLGGRQYGNHAGMCLESQIWPDAPNQPAYPSAVLRPGEMRVQQTVYRFSRRQAPGAKDGKARGGRLAPGRRDDR